jgi:hypothetical protein
VRRGDREPLPGVGRVVLCGLPVRRPPQGDMLYERRHGNFILQITGHPHYGLPSGRTALFRSIWRRWPFGNKAR